MKELNTADTHTRFWTILALLVLVGCSRNLDHTSPDTGDVKELPLTAEEERKSLIQLVERPDDGVIHPDFLAMLLPHLKGDLIDRVNPDEIAIGGWHCNLRKATWNVSLELPNAPRHRLNEWHGVFQRSPDGRWAAKATGSCSAD